MTDVFSSGPTCGLQGLQGDQGVQGLTGPAGALVYNAGGPVANAKIWSGTVTTDANGVWSVNYAAAGFTAVPRVMSNATASGAAAASMVNTKTTTKSATGATGLAVVPALAVLGILSVSLAGAGVSIDVTAIGE